MIHLIDFEDSYTYSLMDSLEMFNQERFGPVQVYHWRESYRLDKVKANDLLVFGPGPGHPDEYLDRLRPLIAHALNPKGPCFFGVCLGHQLLFSYLRAPAKQLTRPVHGVPEVLRLPSWSVFNFTTKKSCTVQKYNSLYIEESREATFPYTPDCWSEKGIIWGAYFSQSRGITYQFHPESVGTSCPKILFNALNHL